MPWVMNQFSLPQSRIGITHVSKTAHSVSGFTMDAGHGTLYTINTWPALPMAHSTVLLAERPQDHQKPKHYMELNNCQQLNVEHSGELSPFLVLPPHNLVGLIFITLLSANDPLGSVVSLCWCTQSSHHLFQDTALQILVPSLVSLGLWAGDTEKS